MNLQQSIDDLERKAAQYTEAANALRALLQNEGSVQDGATGQQQAPRQSGRAAKSATKAKSGAKSGKNGSKRVISDETRARMAAAAKARYEKRRQSQEGQENST